jgi:hypothetical protein
VVCNVNANEAEYMDLLFENEKKSGGGEIFHSAYDNDLMQFIVIYKHVESNWPHLVRMTVD